MKYCGVHRLGRKQRGRNRPIICRFTCRAERDKVWRKKGEQKGTRIYISEDLSKKMRDLRKSFLIPAVKRARKARGTKAIVVGDRLIVDSKVYFANSILERWLNDDFDNDG